MVAGHVSEKNQNREFAHRQQAGYIILDIKLVCVCWNFRLAIVRLAQLASQPVTLWETIKRPWRKKGRVETKNTLPLLSLLLKLPKMRPEARPLHSPLPPRVQVIRFTNTSSSCYTDAEGMLKIKSNRFDCGGFVLSCTQVSETLHHFVYECHCAKLYWEDFETFKKELNRSSDQVLFEGYRHQHFIKRPILLNY